MFEINDQPRGVGENLYAKRRPAVEPKDITNLALEPFDLPDLPDDRHLHPTLPNSISFVGRDVLIRRDDRVKRDFDKSFAANADRLFAGFALKRRLPVSDVVSDQVPIDLENNAVVTVVAAESHGQVLREIAKLSPQDIIRCPDVQVAQLIIVFLRAAPSALLSLN